MRFARRLPSSSSKQAFTEISNLLRGSNIWWRGKSYAASVPSDTPKVKKVRKRVPKADRKVMVESFVDKYRAMNSGKFPSASDTYKEVGGSYYVIREMVQELEYKSKLPSIDTRSETALSKEVDKQNKSVSTVEVLSREMTKDEGRVHKEAQAVAVDNTDATNSSGKHFEVNEQSQISISIENTLSKEVQEPKGTCEDSGHLETHSHSLNEDAEEASDNSPEKLEDSVKEKTPSEGVLDFDPPKPKTEQHQLTPESEKFEMRDLSEKQTDEEIEKKSSMWGNLKSLAGGIINIWRKL
ncbi:hypothetical protein LguiA_027761 [Lonicera macranthoides]